jgi:hypothetical protein
MAQEDRRAQTAAVHTEWQAEIPDEQWSVYQRVIRAMREQNIKFALGGAVSSATYTGEWRNTKDLDLFILPRDREAVVDLLTRLDLADLYEREPYDRGWIYRTCEGDTIVDVIWTMSNRRAEVDEDWLTRGPAIDLHGERVQVLPVEEVIWNKIYVFHRDRCDWTDVLNLIYVAGRTLDWQHLLQCVAEDALLLSGVLCVFAWLCPGRATKLPNWLWERLHLPAPRPGPEVDQHRVDLLDTRRWFLATLDEGESLEL